VNATRDAYRIAMAPAFLLYSIITVAAAKDLDACPEGMEYPDALTRGRYPVPARKGRGLPRTSFSTIPLSTWHSAMATGTKNPALRVLLSSIRIRAMSTQIAEGSADG